MGLPAHSRQSKNKDKAIHDGTFSDQAYDHKE